MNRPTILEGLRDAGSAAYESATKALDPKLLTLGAVLALAACSDDSKVSPTDDGDSADTAGSPVDTGTDTQDTDTNDTDDTDIQDTDTGNTDTDDTDTGTEVDPDAMTVMAKEDCETLFVNGDGAERMDVDNLSDSNYVVSNGAYATYDGSNFEDTNFGRSDSTASVFVCVINGNGEAAEFSTVQVVPGTDANPEQTLTIQGQGIELNGGALTAWFMSAEPRQLLVEDSEDENAPWIYSAGAGSVDDLQYIAPQAVDNQYFLVD